MQPPFVGRPTLKVIERFRKGSVRERFDSERNENHAISMELSHVNLTENVRKHYRILIET